MTVKGSTLNRRCTIDGCTRKHLATGLCSMHYARKTRLGDPNALVMDRRPAAPRNCSFDEYLEFHGFVRKIVRPDYGLGECWLWSGPRDAEGYATWCRGGQSPKRIARILLDLSSPELVARHKCDVPGCIRPDHLISGTPLQNDTDRVLRNRQARGVLNGASKLCDEDIFLIRSLSHLGSSQRSLAEKFNVSKRLIGKIIHRELWKHLQ